MMSLTKFEIHSTAVGVIILGLFTSLSILAVYGFASFDSSSAYTSPLYFSLNLPLAFFALIAFAGLLTLIASNRSSWYWYLVAAASAAYLIKCLSPYLAFNTLIYSDAYVQYRDAWEFGIGLMFKGPHDEAYLRLPGVPLFILVSQLVTGLGPLENSVALFSLSKILELTITLAFTRRYFGREASVVSILFLCIFEPFNSYLNAYIFAMPIAFAVFLCYLRSIMQESRGYLYTALLMSVGIVTMHAIWPIFVSAAVLTSATALYLGVRVEASLSKFIVRSMRGRSWLAGIVPIVGGAAWNLSTNWPYYRSIIIHWQTAGRHLGLQSQVSFETQTAVTTLGFQTQTAVTALGSSSLSALPHWGFAVTLAVQKLTAYTLALVAIPLLFYTVLALRRHVFERFHAISLSLFGVVSFLYVIDWIGLTGYEFRGAPLFLLSLAMLSGLSISVMRIRNRNLHKIFCVLVMLTLVISPFAYGLTTYQSFTTVVAQDDAAARMLARSLAPSELVTGDPRIIPSSMFFAFPKDLYVPGYVDWGPLDFTNAMRTGYFSFSSVVMVDRMTANYLSGTAIPSQTTLTYEQSLYSNTRLNVIYDNGYSVAWGVNSASNG